MTITVIGTGFVGLVTASVFASFGHTVYGLDIDARKIALLKKAKAPFFEPHLDELLKETLNKKKLKFTTDYAEAISASQVILVAVGTPSSESGGVDITYVKSALVELSKHLKPGTIVAIKSTLPPGAVVELKKILDELVSVQYSLATVPEFLREGSAVSDTLKPARIVIGTEDPDTFAVLKQLHSPFNAPVIQTKPASAQMAKYAANAYLATRITFINQIADLCEKNGADVEEVIQAIGYDPRIRSHYWYPGLGYGGSCFPKDVRELAYFSRQVGEKTNLFNKIQEINDLRLGRLMTQFANFVSGWEGKTVAVLGLAFKPNTDDTREAPSAKIIPQLLSEGATVYGYDPKASLTEFIRLNCDAHAQYSEKKSIVSACKNADVILLLIEWPEIASFNYSSVKNSSEQYIIDTRNILDKSLAASWGYHYRGIGRGDHS